MKNLLLALCGCLLATAVCEAQQPAETPAPLLFVYAVRYEDNALPRIALGLEKPALKIQAFEKCVTLPRLNPGLAVQLKPEDAKTLIAAIKTLGAPDAKELPGVFLWFTTPDNQALGAIVTSNPPSNEINLVKAGVLSFGSQGEGPIVSYLLEKLHPQ